MDLVHSEQAVTNDTAEPMTVVLEPWGDTLTLAPGASFRIVATSTQSGRLELDRDADTFVIYGWPGSRLSVHLDGVLIHSSGAEVPATPPGMSVRDFLDATGASRTRKP